jgi:hypothetical protein
VIAIVDVMCAMRGEERVGLRSREVCKGCERERVGGLLYGVVCFNERGGWGFQKGSGETFHRANFIVLMVIAAAKESKGKNTVNGTSFESTTIVIKRKGPTVLRVSPLTSHARALAEECPLFTTQPRLRP